MAAIAEAIAAPKSVSPTIQRFKDALRRHPTAIAGAIVLVLMMLVAIFAAWLGTIDPQALSPIRRLRPMSDRLRPRCHFPGCRSPLHPLPRGPRRLRSRCEYVPVLRWREHAARGAHPIHI